MQRELDVVIDTHTDSTEALWWYYFLKAHQLVRGHNEVPQCYVEHGSHDDDYLEEVGWGNHRIEELYVCSRNGRERWYYLPHDQIFHQVLQQQGCKSDGNRQMFSGAENLQ